jgi:hypothetical protein
MELSRKERGDALLEAERKRNLKRKRLSKPLSREE